MISRVFLVVSKLNDTHDMTHSLTFHIPHITLIDGPPKLDVPSRPNPFGGGAGASLLSALQAGKKGLKKVDPPLEKTVPPSRDTQANPAEDMSAWRLLEEEVLMLNLEKSGGSIEIGDMLGQGKFSRVYSGNFNSKGSKLVMGSSRRGSLVRVRGSVSAMAEDRNAVKRASAAGIESFLNSISSRDMLQLQSDTSVALKQALWIARDTAAALGAEPSSSSSNPAHIPPAIISREFLQEIRALSALSHPCVIQLYGVVLKPKLTLLLELMDDSLFNILQDNKAQVIP